MDDYNTNSYQNAPQIKHLNDDVHQQESTGSTSWYYYGRSDATLEPNTGLTNRYDYALFGLALHELLDRLRYSILISAVWLLFVLFLTWWTRLVRPVGLVLSFLLALLDLVLLVVEVSSIFRGPMPTAPTASTTTTAAGGGRGGFDPYHTQQQQRGVGQKQKLTELIDQTEQVGLVVLFHPVGKTCYLILCGALCWWIGGGWEIIVGLSFFLEALVLLYCWVTYPEFRRTFDHSDHDPNPAAGGAHRTVPVHTAPMTWSHFYDGTDSSSFAFGVSPTSSSSTAGTTGAAASGGEGASLLLKQAARHAFGM